MTFRHWATDFLKIMSCKQNMYSQFRHAEFPSGLYYKCYTIKIYDLNDSGQYYKTTTTMVIYDPS